MRLINTKTHALREFFDSAIPPYAILSHRWEEDEASFKDFSKGRSQGTKGHTKILQFCSLAASRGFEWGWVDTCCIDKRSSAELSEAINAMFKWYAGAKICYVYLSDVTGRDDFAASQWFTRGRTLQELVAPSEVEFFTEAWIPLGFRDKMTDELSTITGVDNQYLVYQSWGKFSPEPLPTERIPGFRRACVAEKMSWAAHRQTSRAEDIAYCLLGIFEINMPLLYGEGGHAAFRRLQKEILLSSGDESIFAWYGQQVTPNMLAASTADFSGCGMIRRLISDDKRFLPLALRPPSEITSKGLRMEAHLLVDPGDMTTESWDVFSMPIRCMRKTQDGLAYPLLLELNALRVNEDFPTLRTFYRIALKIKTPQQWESMLLNSCHGEPLGLSLCPRKQIYLHL